MKKLLLAVTWALVLCVLSGCAYLPLAGLTDMLPATKPSEAQIDGDSVIISREEYDRYQQFDTLIELMDLANASFFEDVNEQDMLDGAAMGLLSGTRWGAT